ncbi:MAG TPA: hypothetical protein VFB45_15505 [Pseudolabrys sp.]|nr:hypothetical protein [Pseudolabrys sp.]
MRAPFGNSEFVANEIGGRFRPGEDEIVRPLFGPVCKVIWPVNTDAEIAAIAGCDVRTARRWLAHESDADPIVYVEMQRIIIRSRRPVRK